MLVLVLTRGDLLALLVAVLIAVVELVAAGWCLAQRSRLGTLCAVGLVVFALLTVGVTVLRMLTDTDLPATP